MIHRRPRKRITKKALVSVIKRLVGGRRRHRVHKRRYHKRRYHKRRYHKKRRCGGRRYRKRYHRRGRGIFDSVNNWLKKTKIIPTIGKHLTPFAGSFAPIAAGVTDYADKAGYGRRRYHTRRHFRARGNPYPYNLAGGSRIAF